jgi:hypothetical protein
MVGTQVLAREIITILLVDTGRRLGYYLNYEH